MKALILILTLLMTAGRALADQVKIGVIVPLSGEMAVHGLEVRRGLELALEGARAKRLRHEYKLLFEDNQLAGAKSVTAAQKLVTVDKVDAVITLWPPTALIVAPVAERAGILHYTIAWDPALARSYSLLLSHQVMVDQIARSSLRLLRKRGFSKAAFLHMQESGFDLGAEKIRNLAGEECVELVIDEAFAPNETDFRTLLTKIAQKKPEAVLVWSVMPSMDLLLRQIRVQDRKIPVSGYLDYAEDLSILEGAEYISEMFASLEFEERYRARYQDAPRSKAPNAYDLMNLLLSGYESSAAKKLSAFELKKFLTQQRDIEGAVGHFSVQEDGNSSYLPVVRKIEAGKGC